MSDRVRLLAAPDVTALGLGELTGIVYGETKPSSSGAEPVVGDRARYRFERWFGAGSRVRTPHDRRFLLTGAPDFLRPRPPWRACSRSTRP